MKAVRLNGLVTKEMLEETRQRQQAWERQQEYERKHAPLEITKDGSLRELPEAQALEHTAAGAGPEAVPPFEFGGPVLELAEVELPKLRRPDEVRVRVLCVGLDETDRELMAGKSGIPPAGETGLTIGHASLGVVEEAGQDSGLAQGDLVCSLVRRPCKDASCVNCRNGHPDYCETGAYTERGIKGMHGCLSEYYVEQANDLVRVPSACLEFGVLAEPQSMVEKVWEQVQRIQQRLIWQPKTAVVLGSGSLGLLAALTMRCLGLDTVVWSSAPVDSPAAELVHACGAEYRQAGASGGAGQEAAPAETLSRFLEETGRRADLICECTGLSPLAFEAMSALAPGGVLALLGGTPGSRGLSLKVEGDVLDRKLALENKCIIGPAGAASRKNFETALYRLEQMDELFPDVLDRLMSSRLTIEQVPSLDFSRIAIKAVVDLVPRSEWEGLLGADSEQVEYSFSV